MSFDRLIKKIVETQNPTVVGLDPKLDFVPDFIKQQMYESYGNTLKAAAEAFLSYNKGLIDELYDIVPAIKPQAAYYEQLGWEGMRVFEQTIAYAKQKGMFVISDGKRNDIGTTMEAYTIAHLGDIEINGETHTPFGADALTVNGYLGTDGITPLLDICNKKDAGIFVLVKTSNPSSGELQDRILDDEKTVYETMGEMCEKWGENTVGQYGYSAVGAVVGATYPHQLETLRAKMPHTFILVPGYGAQGGTANDVKYAFDKNGLGAVVNSSRAILTAYKKENCDQHDYAKAARREALRMKEDITKYLPQIKL